MQNKSIQNQPKTNFMKKFFLFAITLLLLSIHGNSQVSVYSFTQSVLTYTAISGGTQLVSGTSPMDSWVSSAITIPSFTFNGVAYTTAYVTSNGQISLGGSAPSSTTYTGISTGLGSGINICPFSADLDRATTTASTEIRWETVGNEVVFQWTQIKRYGSSMAESFDFQVRLNTTTGVVTFVYQLNSGPYTSSSYQPQVGIRTSATDYTNRKVSTAVNWNTSLLGTVNTDVCRFDGTSPATNFTTGLTYTFTPPAAGTPLLPTNPSPADAAVNVPVNGSVTWTFGTNTVTYDLKFGLTGSMTQVVTGGSAGATGSYTYSALTNSVGYQWQVIEHNGALTTSGPIWSFITICGAVPLPWSENFDAMGSVGANILPACWLATSPSGTPWYSGNAASITYNNPCSAPNYVYVNYTPSSADKFLITPGFALTAATSYDFKFNWVGDGYAGWTGDVLVNTVQAGTGATILGSSFVTPGTTTTATCTQAKRSFTPTTTGTYYFMVKVYNTGVPWDLGFDDFTLELTPTCVEPTSLSMSAITSNSATISWTASATPPANGYDIYYSNSSVPPTSGTTPSGSVLAGVTTYNITSLTPSSSYYVWVRSVCSSSDKSSWAGPSSFNTLCGPVSSLPWSENFDAMATIGNNILPNCWKAESPTGTPWSSGNAASITYNNPCSAPNYVYVNWSPYGPTNFKFLITPGFALTAGTSYDFSFNWVGDVYAGWTGDVLVNTTQTGTGATVLGTTFVDPGTTTTAVCAQVTRNFVPTTTGTYYFMVRITNTITPYDMGFDDFMLTGPPCLAPSTLTATNITTTDADLGWTSAATAWEYQYGLAGYTPTPTGTATTTNPAHISGLTAATAYNFYTRSNCSGNFSPWAGPMAFTTSTAPPTVVTLAATAISTTGATLNGTVNANGASTTVSFDYGLTVAYGINVSGVPATVTGTTTTASLKALTGLLPNTMYHFRIKGVNSLGTVDGDDMTFTTLALPPTIVTNAATSVTQTSVQLNGTVTANNTSTAVTFQYGLTTGYGSTIDGIPATVSGATATAVLANISGLLPSTLYHFKCVGVNLGGTISGGDLTFTTPAPALPTVVTVATLITNLTTATVFGTVTANGASTAVTFEYGLDTFYGSTIAGVPSPVSGNTPTAVSADLTSLIPLTLYHYRVVGANSVGTANGQDMTFTTVCAIAGPAGPITGPANVCQGGSGYVYTVTIPAAVGFIWTLPIGGTITSGANTHSITVSYAYNAAPGYLLVYGTAPCGNGAPSQLAVSVNPPANPAITGPASVCLNSCGNIYTTQSGMTNYTWQISAGGTITAGGTLTSPTATVCWNTTGAKTVSVNYNNATGCAGLTPAVYNVTVNPLPVPVITGPSPACTNYPVVYTTDASMTGYAWLVSGGGTFTGQGTNAITVTWPTVGAKTVSVNYVNASLCTAAAPVVKNVTVNAGAAPTITGLNNVGVNSGYITYTTEPGMTGYIWTVSSGGVINFGSGSNSILVTWVSAGAQWVRVSYTNSNGCAPVTPTQLNVTVNPLPGPAGNISGTPDVCGGATGVAYSVDPIQNASTYVWTLPAGATPASGSGTNAITVNFAQDAASGDITVYGNNVYGNGTASPAYTVAVTPLPATPVITLDFYTLTSNVSTGNQWYIDGSIIPGSTGQTHDAGTTGTGTYSDVVTINDCPSDSSNNIFVLVEGLNDLTGGNFSIYPIPNDGRFNVSIVSHSQETFTISVFNNIGMKIFEARNIVVNGTLDKVIDLKPAAQGIYSVILQNGKSQVEKKIIINK